MENLNINKSECVKEQGMITGTNYVNICTGQTTFVPIGSADLLCLVFLLISLMACLACVRKILKHV